MKYLCLILSLGLVSCSSKSKVKCSEENTKQSFFILARGMEPMSKVANSLATLSTQLQEKKITEDEFSRKIEPLNSAVDNANGKIKSELKTFIAAHPECQTNEMEKFLNK